MRVPERVIGPTPGTMLSESSLFCISSSCLLYASRSRRFCSIAAVSLKNGVQNSRSLSHRRNLFWLGSPSSYWWCNALFIQWIGSGSSKILWDPLLSVFSARRFTIHNNVILSCSFLILSFSLRNSNNVICFRRHQLSDKLSSAPILLLGLNGTPSQVVHGPTRLCEGYNAPAIFRTSIYQQRYAKSIHLTGRLTRLLSDPIEIK